MQTPKAETGPRKAEHGFISAQTGERDLAIGIKLTKPLQERGSLTMQTPGYNSNSNAKLARLRSAKDEWGIHRVLNFAHRG
jgi:hypothetical protein